MKTAKDRMLLICQLETLAKKIHVEKFGNYKTDTNKKHFAICRELAAKELGIL